MRFPKTTKSSATSQTPYTWAKYARNGRLCLKKNKPNQTLSVEQVARAPQMPPTFPPSSESCPTRPRQQEERKPCLQGRRRRDYTGSPIHQGLQRLPPSQTPGLVAGRPRTMTSRRRSRLRLQARALATRHSDGEPLGLVARTLVATARTNAALTSAGWTSRSRRCPRQSSLGSRAAFFLSRNVAYSRV